VIFILLTTFSFADDINGYIDNIEAKYTDVSSLSATFTQETSNVMLSTPFVQEGRLSIARPHYLHWKIATPMEQHFYADKEKITVWTPSQNQAIISSNQEQSHDVSALLTNLNDLKKRYKIELIDTENGQFHLKLSSEKMDGEIQLWFTENDYILRQVQVSTKNSNTKVTLKDVILNPKLNTNEFQFVPSKDADVIDSRQ